jgi:hypothetical protein
VHEVPYIEPCVPAVKSHAFARSRSRMSRVARERFKV